MSDYWQEHAEIAMNEAKLTATDDQLDTIAGVIESAHEFYGQAMGHDVASANFKGTQEREVADLKRALEAERRKGVCPECRGRGWITTSGEVRSSTSQCWKCHGDGRL